MTSAVANASEPATAGWWAGLRDRELHSFPSNRARVGYLGLTVVVTIVLYYMAYCGGSVSTLQLTALHLSVHFIVWVFALGNAIGAVGSWFAGLTDRVGRVWAVVVGMTVTSLLTLFALPASPNRWVFAVLALVVGNVEGIVLVATPALIRDFSVQTSRARAMGTWTLGPVLGSLIVSLVGTWTIHGTPPASFWGHEYVIAGAVGLVASVLAGLFLRELAPELRDQILVSEADRVVAELRAKGLDLEESMRRPFRQMLKPDVIISGFAVSVLLLAYYTAIGLGTIILQVVFGFSLHQANAVTNWMWGVDAVTAVLVGIASDRLGVRKPFMVAGALVSAVGIVLYIARVGHHTSPVHVAVIISIISFGLTVAYIPWMASFTETVEAKNPALTATGLAVWGLTLRVVVFVLLVVFPVVVTTLTPLVNFGVRTSPYTSAIEFAGTHQSLIGQIEDPANTAQLQHLAVLQASHPADMAAVKAGSSQLATLGQFQPEVAAVAAHQSLFQSVFASPSAPSGSLEAQAVAALGGGSLGQQRLQTLWTNRLQLIPALLWAQAHLGVVAFVEHNTQALTWAATHQQLIAQVQKYGPELALLQKAPPSVLAYANANGATVLKASKANPAQIRTWYWICFAGPILFLAGVPFLRGRWSPRRAREDLAAHEAEIQAELARLAGSPDAVDPSRVR